MKKTQWLALFVVLALTVGLLLVGSVAADPGNGKGKGTCKTNNKLCTKTCAPPPAGCTYFECSKCGCDYLCADGTTITETSSLAFLGLTMGCARCHDHKYDAISQREYFGLQAFFAPLVERAAPDVPAAEVKAHAAQQKAWEEATAKLRRERDELFARVRKNQESYRLTKFRPEIQNCVKMPARDRGPVEEQVARMAMKQVRWKFSSGDLKKLSKEDRKRYEKRVDHSGSDQHRREENLPRLPLRN